MASDAREFFDGRNEENDEQRHNGRVLVGRGNIRNLLYDGGEQEEEVGVF